MGLCRYLHRYGWQLRILSVPDPDPSTRDESLKAELPSSIPVTPFASATGRTPGHMLPRSMPGTPDRLVRYRKQVVRLGLSMIEAAPPDLIMPLVPLHSLNLAAMDLSGRTGIPAVPYFTELWVADCRTREPRGLRKLLTGLMERHTVRAASALVTATEGGAGYFLQRYPGICPPTHVAANSFDPDRVTPADPVPRGDTLRIAWVDDFWGSHNPEPLFGGISEFLRRNPDAAVSVEHTGQVPRSQGAVQKVMFHGTLPWRGIPGFMSSCHLLLLSLPPGRQTHRYCPGIAADCLRTGRPIMAATPEGDMSQKLRSLGNAYICDPDPMAVASTLENVYDHWRKGILQAPRDQVRISEQLDATGVIRDLAAFLAGVAG